MSIEQHLTPAEQTEADRLLKLGYVWLGGGDALRYRGDGMAHRRAHTIRVAATTSGKVQGWMVPCWVMAVVQGTERMQQEIDWLVRVSTDGELQVRFSSAYRLGGRKAVEHLLEELEK